MTNLNEHDAPPSTFREAVLARLPRMVEGDETIIQDAIAMDAILQLAYFGGGDVTIGVGGGHDTIYRANWGRGGNADGEWVTVREALIEAAEVLRKPTHSEENRG